MIRKPLAFFKKIYLVITIIGIAIFFIIGAFAMLQTRENRRDYEDKIIIELLEEQKLLSQVLSKDTNLLYNLKEDLTNETDENEQIILETRITTLKQSINSSKEEFETTLAMIESGYIITEEAEINLSKVIAKEDELLQKLDQNWLDLEYAIDKIMDAEDISIESRRILFYLNDNNLVLINRFEEISGAVLDDSMQTSDNVKRMLSVFIVLMGLTIFGVGFYLIRFLIIPFRHLYVGISKLGMHSNYSEFSLPEKQKAFPMVKEVSEVINKLETLFLLINNMNNNYTFVQMLNFINNTFSTFIPYKYIGIALIDNEKGTIQASHGVSDGTVPGLPEKLMGKVFTIKDTSLGKVIESGEARIINDLEKYTTKRPGKLYNNLLIDAGIKASIAVPLKISNRCIGIIFFSSTSKNVYNQGHVEILKVLANSIAVSFNQNILIRDLLYGSTLALAKLAETRDEDTGEHLDRMQYYTKIIASLLYEHEIYKDEMDPEYLEDLERFSPLHDIGKVGVKDSVLLKPGKLTAEEFEEIKQHTMYGEEVLAKAEENLKKAGKSLFYIGVEIAGSHHERWDGKGYPRAKKGLEIPLSARIVAIADVFDALTSKRPYKEEFSYEKSLSILLEEKGRQFDPEIIECIEKNERKMYEAYKRYHPKG